MNIILEKNVNVIKWLVLLLLLYNLDGIISTESNEKVLLFLKSTPKLQETNSFFNYKDDHIPVTKQIEGNRINLTCCVENPPKDAHGSLKWIQYKIGNATILKTTVNLSEEFKLERVYNELDNNTIFYCEIDFRHDKGYLDVLSENVLFLYKETSAAPFQSTETSADCILLISSLSLTLIALIVGVLYCYKQHIKKLSKEPIYAQSTIYYIKLDLPKPSSKQPLKLERPMYTEVVGIIKPKADTSL